MVSKVVKDAQGNEHTIIAQSDEELDQAVKDFKAVKAPVYPNINVPVQKGHDLVEVDEALNKTLVNGEGAHNSPENAIDDNGQQTGDPNVVASGLDEAPFKEVNTGNPVGEPMVAPDKADKPK